METCFTSRGVGVANLDKDGDNDVVVSGKSGLYVFYNIDTAPRGRQPFRMTPEEKYPTWFDWTKGPKKTIESFSSSSSSPLW